MTTTLAHSFQAYREKRLPLGSDSTISQFEINLRLVCPMIGGTSFIACASRQPRTLKRLVAQLKSCSVTATDESHGRAISIPKLSLASRRLTCFSDRTRCRVRESVAVLLSDRTDQRCCGGVERDGWRSPGTATDSGAIGGQSRQSSEFDKTVGIGLVAHGALADSQPGRSTR